MPYELEKISEETEKGKAAQAILKEAEGLFINSEKELIYADKMRASVHDNIKSVTAYFKGMKESTYTAWKNVCGRENELKAPLETAKKVLSGKMSQYQIKVEQQRKKEKEEADRRAARELEKQKEEQAKQNEAEAAKLMEQGRFEEAEAKLDEEPKAPSVAAPDAFKAKPGGPALSAKFRKGYDFKIINESLIPREYLQVNEKAIKQVVKALGTKANIPGVEIFETKTASS